MKIGVISDTHGSQGSIRKIVDAAGNVDLWLHAGDYSQDAQYVTALTGDKVTAVKGNCDGQTTAKIDEFIEVCGKRLWLTHGHRYDVKQGLYELLWWGREYEADIIVYGHSHVPELKWIGDLLVFNPGSALYPRFGQPTFGILEINGQGKILPSIVEI
jgi:putative phosphoesterase